MQLFDVYPLYPIRPVRGSGHYVYDEQGQAYLDLYGGHAVISIGHSHPHFVKKVGDQLAQLAFYSNSVLNDLQTELAERLGRQSGYEDYFLFLINSGAEANENALKLASFHQGRTKIVAFDRAFHGRTSAAVNVTHNPAIQAPLNQTFPTVFLPWNDQEAVREHLQAGDVAAVIIEGIQGVGGIHVPDPDFLLAVQALCRATDTILILDEIQSGYGRSGQFFAHQYVAGLQPDIITIAKGMGNGFPIGGVLIHPRFSAKPGLLGTTFGGNHLACAAGLAVLEVIAAENLVANAAKVGDYLMNQLEQHFGNYCQVRGRGLMIGLEFDFNTAGLRKHLLLEEKTFTGSAGNPNVVRLLPALSLGQTEADLFLERLEKSLHKMPKPALA